MNELAKYLSQFDAELSADFQPHACYYESMDLVEYITVDCITISDRIDTFLTLIFDKSGEEPVGFKLKGFKYIFNEYLKAQYQLQDESFLPLISILQGVVQQVGDDIFNPPTGGNDRERAYRSAFKLVRGNNVMLSGIPDSLAA